MRRGYQRGYTLIEILVGLTIIGLIFAIGFVSFREFSRRQSILGAARSIKGDLRLAQVQALSGKKPTSINCNPPKTLDGFNFRVASGNNYVIEANCSGGIVQVKSVTISSDLSLSFPSPNPVTFKVLGQGTNIPSGNATVTLSQAGTANQVVITISQSGEIK